MKPFRYALDASLGYHASLTHRLMSRRLNRRFFEAGLEVTPEQWAVLVHLADLPVLFQEDAAGFLCLDKSSLSRILDTLERKGYLRRARDPGDARRKRIVLTDKTEGILEDCGKEALHTTARAVRGIAPEDLDVCLRVLRHVQQNMQEEEI